MERSIVTLSFTQLNSDFKKILEPAHLHAGQRSSDLIVVSPKRLDEPSVNMDKLDTEDIEQGGGHQPFNGEQSNTEHNIFQVKEKQETMDVESIEADKEYIDQDRGSSVTSENDTNSTLSGGEVNLAFIPETSPRGHSRKPSSVLSDISIHKNDDLPPPPEHELDRFGPPVLTPGGEGDAAERGGDYVDYFMPSNTLKKSL
ncbi:uncharacterized protein LOC111704817, partial [Eurytemora carolleeae]|uniref:uncharacterized protein LOC111704817 n=1 Tax=Eurytemora carolleeae TaxID=1294199 RepID=UPI000C792755